MSSGSDQHFRLSQCYFVIAIDLHNHILQLYWVATSPLRGRLTNAKALIYVDNATIFVTPFKHGTVFISTCKHDIRNHVFIRWRYSNVIGFVRTTIKAWWRLLDVMNGPTQYSQHILCSKRLVSHDIPWVARRSCINLEKFTSNTSTSSRS
jgi:hypothetical protein